MKKFYQIGMLAVAALAFASCNKEIEDPTPETTLRNVEVSFSKVVDTKTAVVEGEAEASYVWTTGDEAYLHVYENGKEGTINSVSYSADMKTATLNVAFETATASSYVYTAKYANTISGSGNPAIPAAQSPKANSFDPAADVLVSKEITEGEPQTSLQFTMGRVATVNKMTLTGLEEGEAVSKVEFELDKAVSAYYVESTKSYSTIGKKLTLTYESDNTVGSDGKFPIYFVSAPVDAAGIVSVVVTTDKNVYTKTSSLDPNPFDGKTITFAVGTMKRFTMAMIGYGETISAGTVYTLVEKTSDLYDGATYIIAATDVDRAMQTYVSGNNHKAVTITKNATGKTITIDNTINAEPFIINSTTGGFTFKSTTNNKYLVSSSTANRLTEAETAEVFTISIDNGTAAIVSKSNTSRGYMYYNSNSTSGNLFNCYADKSSDTSKEYHLLALYVDKTTCVELEEAGLAWSAEIGRGELTDEEPFAELPTLTNPNGLTVTYSSSDEKVATIDAEGAVDLVGPGATVISASFAGDDIYKPTTVTYTLSVEDRRSAVATPTFSVATGSKVNAGTEITISTETEGATIFYTTGTSDYSTGDWTEGSTFTLNTSCTVKAIAVKEGMKNSDVASATYTCVGLGQSLDNPYTVSQALEVAGGLKADNDTKNMEYISGIVSKVEQYYSTYKTISYYISDDGTTANQLYIYSGSGLVGEDFRDIADIAVGDKIIVWGELYNYKGTTLEVKYSTIEYIDEQAPRYTVTLEAAENGTVTASATSVGAQSPVTLTVTPDSGYELDELTVTNDSTGENITVTGNVFTMPAANVTVKATFKVKEAGDPVTATIKFGSNDVKISAASVTGSDDQKNSWTITTVGTTSFTANNNYYQVGSSSKPATSITFTTTLPAGSQVSEVEGKFGGFSGTAGTVTLKVGDNTVGTGSLNATTDITVKSTSTAAGNVVTVTVTGISKGVKAYYITVTYE